MNTWNSLPSYVKFARLISVLLVAVFILYIFIASAMILGASEELFPKMALSFLALIAMSATVVSTWRWPIAGSLASLATLLGYRYAEFLRLGYSWGLGLFSYGVILLALIYIIGGVLRQTKTGKSS